MMMARTDIKGNRNRRNVPRRVEKKTQRRRSSGRTTTRTTQKTNRENEANLYLFLHNQRREGRKACLLLGRKSGRGIWVARWAVA